MKFEVVTPIVHNYYWEVEADSQEDAVALAEKTPPEMLDRVAFVKQEVAPRQQHIRSSALRAYVTKEIKEGLS